MTASTEPADTLEARLFSVVLAAGSASRFGSSKQLADVRGKPLVRRAVQLAESVTRERALLCVGARWQAVYEAASPLSGFLVRNEGHADGIGSSIATITRVLPASADGLMLLLADQALIEASDLEILVRQWQQEPEMIVCSHYAGIEGPPAIFPARLFPELCELEGDQGARRLIARHQSTVRRVDIARAAFDVDTPEDLSNLPG